MKEEKEHRNEEEEQEVDLLEFGIKLWDEKRRLIMWTIWGAVIGILIAFSIPKEYKATVRLVPESEGNRGGGNLSAVASFAGISMGVANGEDAVYPDLYPDVVASKPFTVALFGVRLPNDEPSDSAIALYDILRDHTSSPWWGTILGLPGKTIGAVRGLISSKAENNGSQIDPFRLTPEQDQMATAVNSRVWAEADKKSGVITINAKLQDPLAAASLADSVTERLKEYIIDYRTGKARNDLAYAKKINDEARESYLEAQKRYATYADRNQGLVSRVSSIELERLQNEATLAFNLYNSTSQQVQLADAKVQNNTPVFAVVEPATVPVKATEPKKIIIIIVFAIIGFLAAAAYTLFGPGVVNAINEKRRKFSD